MTTATFQRRPSGPRETINSLLSAISAKLAEIYGFDASNTPKSESWHYYSA